MKLDVILRGMKVYLSFSLSAYQAGLFSVPLGLL